MVAAEHARPTAEVEEDYGGAGSDGADNLFEPKIVTLMYEYNILLSRVQFWTTSRLASIPTLFPYRLFSSGEENTCYVQNLPLWLT